MNDPRCAVAGLPHDTADSPNIEKRFNVSFVAALALREKQIQQSYRPIIAVHKWFARRPGTLFRSLLLSEFGDGPLKDNFYESNDLTGKVIADPFMGGGTPLLEANRLGCDVHGYDINPMAWWIVRQEISHLDLTQYRAIADNLIERLRRSVGHLYQTSCCKCGSADAVVKYFLWVKTTSCSACNGEIDLFSGYLLAEDRRHPLNVFVCPSCGEFTETKDRKNPGSCLSCGTKIPVTGPAKRGRCQCRACGVVNKFPRPERGPLRHRMFAIEYHCEKCRTVSGGRYFKKPDALDLGRYDEATEQFKKIKTQYVPTDSIPKGDESDRLHRWGLTRYSEMFNDRQLLGLELSAQAIAGCADQKIREALATNLSDLLRYQNMLCRYDTMALKSLDIFSVHGFPIGLIQCESNILGIRGGRTGVNVGSGGWGNIVEKFQKAKAYCDDPFEVRHTNGRKTIVPIRGEWIGEDREVQGFRQKRMVNLRCESSTDVVLPENSVDAVFTDPPYFGNVQYAELMDFCYVWLKRLVGDKLPAFKAESTRNNNELTGNITMDRGLPHFATGLSHAFQKMNWALKPGGPLAFTFHHNAISAYYPVAVAILDCGLVCSASLPCPAEMGGSIHISGTGSSIIDTVFVCRSTGRTRRRWIVESAEAVAELVVADAHHLEAAGVKVTRGDLRCVSYGHLIRLAVWQLRNTWKPELPVEQRLSIVHQAIFDKGGYSAVEQYLETLLGAIPQKQPVMREESENYGTFDDTISF